MLTLQSMNLGSPGLEERKEIGAVEGECEGEKVERPGVERFVTADMGGLGLGATGETGERKGTEKENEKGVEGLERPGVERFETAREDLSTLAGKAEEKA